MKKLMVTILVVGWLTLNLMACNQTPITPSQNLLPVASESLNSSQNIDAVPPTATNREFTQAEISQGFQILVSLAQMTEPELKTLSNLATQSVLEVGSVNAWNSLANRFRVNSNRNLIDDLNSALGSYTQEDAKMVLTYWWRAPAIILAAKFADQAASDRYGTGSSHGAKSDGRGNAARHALWNTLIAEHFYQVFQASGWTRWDARWWAMKWTNAHECLDTNNYYLGWDCEGSATKANGNWNATWTAHVMDFQNNWAGRVLWDQTGISGVWQRIVTGVDSGGRNFVIIDKQPRSCGQVLFQMPNFDWKIIWSEFC